MDLPSSGTTRRRDPATLSTIGLVVFEGAPSIGTSVRTILALADNGGVGTALGFWAMTVVNRRVPAPTTALCVLATPVVGIGLDAALLGEGLDPLLIPSATVILIGLVIGTRSRSW